MSESAGPAASAMPLRDALVIPEVVSATDFVLQLQTGVQDPAHTVGEYVVTDSLREAFGEALGYVDAALQGRSDRGVYIHGSFGSGKSHFMAILDLMLRGEPAARALPNLQAVVAEHPTALAANLLTVEYHLIGAESLEQALFSGYLARVAALHPDHTPPLLHRSDALVADALRMREMMGDDAFFGLLNDQLDGQWGDLEEAWTGDSVAAALAAPVGTAERVRVTDALAARVLPGYTAAAEWLPIDEGLQSLAEHAHGLGYHAVVLFLDEIVLWLASNLSDPTFISREAAKVGKLVESGTGRRRVPLVSFAARQKDLGAFLGDVKVAGVTLGSQTSALGQSLTYWEKVFDSVVLEASDLPEIARRRLLARRDEAGEAALAAAVARLKAHRASWDALLDGADGADEAAFAKVYPFSPALVDTLVSLSSLLQRERTALKVMAHLLVDGRDELTVDDVIPVGDLYDVMVDGGDQPLTEEMRRHFGHARALYREKLRPQLLAQHGLTDAEAEATARQHPFRRDDRLAKTLLVAAIAPQSHALRRLTASRLAALNHGAVAAFAPGMEAATVLGKVRAWAETVGEIHIGEGADPVISIELAGVDYDSVLERVANEDTESARRTMLKRLVFADLGVDDSGMLPTTTWPLVWRGSKRTLELVFGNIRDESVLPDDLLRATGDTWKVVIDYPFDAVGHGPQDDVTRLAMLSAAGVTSRTVGWVPSFLTAARQDDLGKLVLLEHLLGGTGEQFDRHAAHLPVDQRPLARTALDNLRRTLRERLTQALKQAYGVARREPADVDLESYGDVTTFPTLAPGLTLAPPVGATLRDALAHLADQMLSSQYPDHPRFEPSTTEVRRADLAVVLDYAGRARSDAGGRVEPVEQAKRPALRRVANTLGVGQCYENHYVFDTSLFPWRTSFVAWAAEAGGEISVAALRERLAPWGLSRDVASLLIASWALLDDKQFARHGASVTVTDLQAVGDDLVLRDPALPEQASYDAARARASALFGVSSAGLLTAAAVAALATGVRSAAVSHRDACAQLLAQLTSHAATLGLGDDSPRLLSARLGADLTARLAGESDDLVLVEILAQAAVPAEPQPLGTSIASAGALAAALQGASWEVLDAVAARVDVPEAVAIIEPLRGAARNEEAHAALAPAVRTAGQAAATYLAGVKPPPPPPGPTPPGPTPPPTPPVPPAPPGAAVRSVDDITLDGLDDQVATLTDQMRDALRAEPGKRLVVRWWLE